MKNFLDQSKDAAANLADTSKDLDIPSFLRKAELAPDEWERPEQTYGIGVPHEKAPEAWRIFSEEEPKVPGWYYNRPKGRIYEVTVLLVVKWAGWPYNLVALDPSGHHKRTVNTMVDDEWAGPIPDPIG